MKRLTMLCSPLLISGALLAIGALPAPVHAAQPGTRAYAPERLWDLSTTEQRRVIGLEYREQSSGRTLPDDQMRFYLDQVRLSHWTFSQVKSDIARSLAGNGGPGNGGPGNGGPGHGGPGNGGPGNGTATVRCESTDNRQRTCTTPWRQRAVLVRQLSDKRCVQGQNWSSTPGSVWVSGGCRAEFASERGGGNGNNPGTELRCESSDGRYKQCGSGIYGTPTLVRQLSDTTCRANQSFGVRNGALWVDRGCRGIFRVDGGNAGGPGPGPGPGNGNGNGNGDDYTVTCGSTNMKPATCAWDRSRGTPRLLMTLSSARCTEGVTWGYTQRQGLWTSQGCRARFGVR